MPQESIMPENMQLEQVRALFVIVMRMCVGTPYIYGAQGPDKFDCSGLIMFGMHCIGAKMHDRNAQGLYDLFKINSISEIDKPGQLVFYGNSKTSITHVMTSLEIWAPGMYTLVGARGGVSNTNNLQFAYNQNAMVDVVRGDYWISHRQAVCDPFI